MRTLPFAATFFILFTTNVQANKNVGLYIESQIWQNEVSGVLGEKNTLINSNLKNQQQINYFVAVKHPFPLLPNIRISRTNFNASSQTNSTQAFSFTEGTSDIVHETLIDTEVETHLNASYIDYTLYYQLLNNHLFSLDLGLTVRDFSSATTTTENITTVNNWSDIFGNPYTATRNDNIKNKIKTNEIKPMLYIATNISLSLVGLSVFAQGDFNLINHHTLSDYHIGLNYDLIDSKMIDVSLTLGYRTVKIAFEDLNNSYSDLEFKGTFIGVITHF